MTRTVYWTATTLTGQIADENDSLTWLFAVDQEGQGGYEEFIAGVGVLVMGSTTYEWLLREEDMLAHPEKWLEAYAPRPTFVFTSRDLPRLPGVDLRFVRGEVTDLLPEIRAAAGDGDIWMVGGGDLAGQFLDADALDEIVLGVAPVALPAGAPLLPRRVESDRLRLVSVERQGQFAQLVYSVQRPGRSEAGGASEATP
jgi:dihydrofolate reductase